MTGDDGGKRVKSVERAFAVLGVVREEGSVRIDDVASALDLPTSTAHVHLKTLESVGYVVAGEDGYRPSYRFLRDGVTVRQRSDVYRVARPRVDELAAETAEVANLGVEENGQRVILHQAEGEDAVHDNAPIGEFTNMHWTALGKAILARLPEERVEDIVETYGLPDSLDATITDSGALFDELATTRDREYALEDEERREGIRSVAVPLTVDEDVVGAISVTGPKERFDDARIEREIVPQLRSTRNVIELEYAYE